MKAPCQVGDAEYLLVAEKPKAARAIAEALGDRPVRCGGKKGVPYWVVKLDGKKVIVAPSAGHLFSLDTRERGLPVFTYEWRPRHQVERGYRHTARFYNLFKKLSGVRGVVVNACDYDVEGSVIGYHIITLILGRRDYRRMKYSSLTRDELRQAFKSLHPPDSLMVESGLCRHELDWIWGINSSRLLMEAYKKSTGTARSLSAGRVQTPTLIEAIRAYVKSEAELPLPEYSVEAQLKTPREEVVKATHLKSPFQTKSDAREASQSTPRECLVKNVDFREEKLLPPTPFNLNDLQAEAHRLFRFSPMKAQALAENLYLEGLISYPRTNSQRIPPSVNVRRILENLKSQGYAREVEYIRRQTSSPRPRQGRKTDPAHPAIYPTGKAPGKLGGDEKRLYDLITRRFLASMMDAAVRASVRYMLSCGPHEYRGEARALKHPGWLEYYPGGAKEGALPLIEPGVRLRVERIRVVTRLNKKHKPYTKAGLLQWMESRGIGTEATRAPIIETLFKRGYLRESGGKVEPTPLGIAVALVVERFFPKLTDVQLTREFEEKVEKVREGRENRGAIVDEAKSIVRSLVEEALGDLETAGSMLASYMGAGRGSAKCPLCGLPALESGLCILHQEALESLVGGLAEWERREGVDRGKALYRISSSKQVGKSVRDIAQAVAEGRLLL